MRRDPLGVAAEAHRSDHALADLEDAVDACAERRDRPGHLVADDARRLRRVRVEPDPRHQVGEVDAGRRTSISTSPRPGWGSGSLLHLEYLGRAVFGDHDCAHTEFLSPIAAAGHENCPCAVASATATRATNGQHHGNGSHRQRLIAQPRAADILPHVSAGAPTIALITGARGFVGSALMRRLVADG